jgi:hypothetical protein
MLGRGFLQAQDVVLAVARIGLQGGVVKMDRPKVVASSSLNKKGQDGTKNVNKRLEKTLPLRLARAMLATQSAWALPGPR